jgi:quercetin 2,3-dioxygenase
MSNIVAEPAVQVCEGRPDAGPVRELLPARAVPLGESTQVRRLLPTIGRRMVGAWCFVDHYGPDEIAREPGMQVPPHPHTGLQTVSWLLDGEVHHRDSLGSDVLVRPGELALMTAGAGIAHSEQSPDPHSPVLHGAQLWIALPEERRHRAPSFAHHVGLPVITEGRGLRATVLLGDLAGARSPGSVHTPLHTPSRLLLLGGLPFSERIVMWWNFVARTGDEVAAARTRWQAELAGESGPFGAVPGYEGASLPAPELPPTPLRPRGRAR